MSQVFVYHIRGGDLWVNYMISNPRLYQVNKVSFHSILNQHLGEMVHTVTLDEVLLTVHLGKVHVAPFVVVPFIAPVGARPPVDARLPVLASRLTRRLEDQTGAPRPIIDALYNQDVDVGIDRQTSTYVV